MITYDNIPLEAKELDELRKFKIEYVFQPIFFPDCRTVYAYEALMRPENITVTDLIGDYTNKGKLHMLEVVTMFGAAESYVRRGYKEPMTVNSFPTECLSLQELAVYSNIYKDMMDRYIVEILEYPKADEYIWKMKREILRNKNIPLSLDDFGAGYNGMEAVEMFEPQIVKIDRALISGIDSNPGKQKKVLGYIKKLKEKGILVLAEGVETREETDFLVYNGIDLLQGFYLGMPE